MACISAVFNRITLTFKSTNLDRPYPVPCGICVIENPISWKGDVTKILWIYIIELLKNFYVSEEILGPNNFKQTTSSAKKVWIIDWNVEFAFEFGAFKNYSSSKKDVIPPCNWVIIQSNKNGRTGEAIFFFETV